MSKRQAADIYSGLTLFAQCPKKELGRIASLSTRVQVPPGRVLCAQGDIGREAYIIVDGEASVTIDGMEVAILGPGEIVGELALLDAGPRVATVTTTTQTEILALSAKEFRSLLIEVPRVALGIATVLAQRLRRVEAKA